MDKIVLPIAIGIIVDDVGWHDGRDLRYMNGSARSGLPRFHHPDDVRALNAIGKALNTKIICSLVLGEWDKGNVLRGVPAVTPDPENWDAASAMDMEYTKEYFKALEESEYLDYSLHGLLHAYYDGAKLNTARQYYPNTYDECGKVNGYRWLPAEEFGKMIDLFYKIYGSWGFKKKITTFVSPCGFGGASVEMIEDLATRLSALGIKYWANGGFSFEGPLGVYCDIATMKKGGSYNGKYGPMPPWEGYDIDPELLMPFVNEENHGGTNMVGMHWTNLLRLNPKRNLENLPLWIDYFNRERETFGTMIAKDVEFSVTQQFYNLYSKTEIKDGTLVIDVSDVMTKKTSPCKDEFYISVKKDIAPRIACGGTLSLYEEHNEFNTYKIEHNSNRIMIFL
jgi:hypothetical protein